MAKTTIDISTGNIFKAAIVLLGLFLVYLVRDVVLIFFVSLVLVAALNPPVEWLEKRKIPRILSTILIFFLAIGIFSVSVYIIVPPLAQQLSSLTHNIPELIQKVPFELKADYIQDFLGNAAGYLAGVPVGISTVLVILIITFYLLAQKQSLEKLIKAIAPYRRRRYVLGLSQRIQKKLGYWLLGQVVASLVVGILTFIGLLILKIDYALILGILVGLAEIVPFGPIVAFIPAGILGFMQSPVTGVLVIVLYLIVQQIEGHVIVPQIMKKAVGLNPVLIILALLVGGKLGGILGLAIAIPVAAGLSVFVKDYKQGLKSYKIQGCEAKAKEKAKKKVR
ncbi:hypothetical protein CL633_01155 [bacterium]|nr:hypothetical protein [bacterium]|tara:strand:- start:8947 stop:9957 length:1011 start_codon:yes stop_codon:yes gene_type:complete